MKHVTGENKEAQRGLPALLVMVAIAVTLASSPAPAAVLSVSSPAVKEGEFSLEVGAALERDATDFGEYAVEIAHSPNAFWNTALEFSAESQGDDTAYAVSAWKNTLQFMRQGDRRPLTAALRLQYEVAHIEGEADELAARLLLRHDRDALSYRLNLGVEREVGGGADPDVIGDLRAALRYTFPNGVTPAVEYLGDTGSLHTLQRFESQDHRLGAAFYTPLSDTVTLGAGYYAPLSDGAPDHTFKLTLERSFDVGALF